MQISKKSTVVIATILGVGAVTGVGAATFASEIPLFQGTSGAVESVENSILEPAEDLGPVAELAPLESGVGPALGPEEASAASAPSEASPASAPSEASPASAPSEASPASAPSEASPASAPSEASPASAPSGASAPSSD